MTRRSSSLPGYMPLHITSLWIICAGRPRARREYLGFGEVNGGIVAQGKTGYPVRKDRRVKRERGGGAMWNVRVECEGISASRPKSFGTPNHQGGSRS